jgi:hypothetical protein
LLRWSGEGHVGNDIVIYHSRTRLLLLSIGALLFVILGLLLARSSDLGIIAVGWASIAFFGGCLVYIVSRLAISKPAIVISAQGIHDHASGVGVGLVKWSEIREIRAMTFLNKDFLGIFVSDPEAVIRRQSFLRRSAVRSNLWLVGTPITIPRIGIPMNLEELQALIESRRPQS